MLRKAEIWGLTGGSGCGKSTAARELERLGALVIDADKIARDVVLPGKNAYNEIVKAFGSDILSDNGSINRRKLGKLVFTDSEKLKRLNEITHPAVTEDIKNIISQNKERTIVVDAAALLECEELKNLCDKIIVVCADYNLRINRITERDGITREYAAERIAAQMPCEEVAAAGDVVWYNNGSPEELRRVISDYWNK